MFLDIVHKTVAERAVAESSGDSAASAAGDPKPDAPGDAATAPDTPKSANCESMPAERPPGSLDLEVLDSFTESTRCESRPNTAETWR